MIVDCIPDCFLERIDEAPGCSSAWFYVSKVGHTAPAGQFIAHVV
jgi:hypothetical protein